MPSIYVRRTLHVKTDLGDPSKLVDKLIRSYVASLTRSSTRAFASDRNPELSSAPVRPSCFADGGGNRYLADPAHARSHGHGPVFEESDHSLTRLHVLQGPQRVNYGKTYAFIGAFHHLRQAGHAQQARIRSQVAGLFPRACAESLAAVVRLAALAEKRYADGSLTRPEAVEAVPWADRDLDWLASSLGFLRSVVPTLAGI